MCTIGYHKTLGILFKNRDKQSVVEEEIIADDNVIACRTRGAGYFSWGLNRNGCAFVSAAINSPEWTALVYQGLNAQAQSIYEKENSSLDNPMVTVSTMLAGIRSSEEWVEGLVSLNKRCMGYNIVLVDGKKAFLIEMHRAERHVRKLALREVVTNHFQGLMFGPRRSEDYPSSFRRFNYGNGLIEKAGSLDDVFSMLNPIEPGQRAEIWRNGRFLTISSSVIDFQQGNVYYMKHFENTYSCFSLGTG